MGSKLKVLTGGTLKSIIIKNLKETLKVRAKKSFKGKKEDWSLKYFDFKRKKGKVLLNEKGKNFLSSLEGKIKKDNFKFHKASLFAIHKVKPGKRKIPPIEILATKILEKDKEFSGYFRVLSKPKKEDYLIQKIIFKYLNKKFNKIFSKFSFAYRQFTRKAKYKRPTTKAIKFLERKIEKGLRFVTKIDIEKFFDSVDHKILIKNFKNILNNKLLKFDTNEKKYLIQLIENYLKSIEKTYIEFCPNYKNKGIFQGHPLSCILANVYLHSLDMYLTKKKFCFIRYADDIVILTKTKSAAKDGFKFSKKFLKERLKLNVNTKKSLIGEREFEFLGIKYGKNGEKRIRDYTIEKAKNKIRKITDIKKIKKLNSSIIKINQFLGYKILNKKGKKRLIKMGKYIGKGWVDYFASVSNGFEFLKQMKELDCFTRDRLRVLYGKKISTKKSNKEFYKRGLRSFVGTYKFAVQKNRS